MKSLIIILIVIFAGVSAALIFKDDSGYLLLEFKGWTVEMSFSLFIILSILTILLSHYLIVFFKTAFGIPRRLGGWKTHRNTNNAREALSKGLIALAEGKWKKAEKLLVKQAKQSDIPLLNYLAAARAAQKIRDYESRDEYLRLAHSSKDDADIAVGLTQAELQLAHHQNEQALATLTGLKSKEPKHSYVFELLLRLYTQIGDWEKLLLLLPDFRRLKVSDKSSLDYLELNAYKNLIKSASSQTDQELIKKIWGSLPRRLSTVPELVYEYAHHLIQIGAMDDAERLLSKTINKHWDEKLICLYGMTAATKPSAQLSRAKTWLKDHHASAALNLALGRISMRCEIWGKARQYIESSLETIESPEAYKELGRLLEILGKHDEALACYRKGLLIYSDRQNISPDNSNKISKKEAETSQKISAINSAIY